MHANIQTVSFRGIDTIAVDVQVHIANGLQAMAIVGLVTREHLAEALAYRAMPLFA